MKIEYYLSEDKIYQSDIEGNSVPSVGHMVFLKEIFYVEDVIWYPDDNIVRIYLNDEKPKDKSRITESSDNVVNSSNIQQVRNTANKALKETENLKRQIFSIRQFLRIQKK